MQPIYQTLPNIAPQKIFTETEVKIKKKNIRDLNVQLCSCATLLFFTAYRAYENEDLNLRRSWIMVHSVSIGFTAMIIFLRQSNVSDLKKMSPVIKDQLAPAVANAVHLKHQNLMPFKTMGAHFQIIKNLVVLNFTKDKIFSSTDDTLQCCMWVILTGAETLLISKVVYDLFKYEFEKASKEPN